MLKIQLPRSEHLKLITFVKGTCLQMDRHD